MNPQIYFPAFSSQKFVITVEIENERRKIFQILFQKKDGSLLVAFPYYRESCGLLALATLKAKIAYPTNIPLQEGGKVTGHKVKYSHHPDGTAHFSQDGKILTKIRKRSVPLIEAEGHIFTLQFQGIRDFSILPESEQKPLISPKKTILNIKFEGTPEAVKFAAHWFSQSAALKQSTKAGSEPWFVCERPDGSRVMGFLIVNPFLSSNENHYLLLTCEAIPTLDHGRYSTLTFAGGFDPKEIAFNHDLDTQCLLLAYPASETYSELVKKIGTVDYVKPNIFN